MTGFGTNILGFGSSSGAGATPFTLTGFLVIAGGGSGGPYGGGGGAGGYRSSFNNETSGGGGSAETALELTTGTTEYTVTCLLYTSDAADE